MKSIKKINYFKNLVSLVSCFFVAIFILLNFASQAQDRRRDLNYYSILSKKVDNNIHLENFGHKKGIVETCYWDEQWRKSNILLVMDSILIRNVETRIDVRCNGLEVKYKGEIKAIPCYRVNFVQFIDNDDVFITENILKSSQKGFYKVMLDDKNMLLCGSEIEIVKANYNIALGVGNKHDMMVRKEKFFIYSQNGILIRMELSKGKMRKQFRDKPLLYDYLRENKTNPRDKVQLVKFIKFINKNNVDLILQ
ncbi:hypothetical protein [Labilibaculum euxinus]